METNIGQDSMFVSLANMAVSSCVRAAYIDTPYHPVFVQSINKKFDCRPGGYVRWASFFEEFQRLRDYGGLGLARMSGVLC